MSKKLKADSGTVSVKIITDTSSWPDPEIEYTERIYQVQLSKDINDFKDGVSKIIDKEIDWIRILDSNDIDIVLDEKKGKLLFMNYPSYTESKAKTIHLQFSEDLRHTLKEEWDSIVSDAYLLITEKMKKKMESMFERACRMAKIFE